MAARGRQARVVLSEWCGGWWDQHVKKRSSPPAVRAGGRVTSWRRHFRAFTLADSLKKTMYVLASVHLTVIAMTILHGVDEWVVHKGWWQKSLVVYSSLNYAVWRFGFFSPDVGSSSEVEITLHTDSGETKRYSTLQGFRFFTSNLESANRFYGFKTRTAGDDAFQDLSARSVAARMLNIHEDAWRMDYAVRKIRYPAMDEYLRGAPIRTVEFYTTTFVLRSAQTSSPQSPGRGEPVRSVSPKLRSLPWR